MNKPLVFLGVLYIFSVVFAPPLSFPVFGADLGVRWDDFIIILGLAVSLLSKRGAYFLPRHLISVLFILYALAMLIMISALFNMLWSDYLFSNSAKELFRYIKYILVAVVFFQIKDHASQRVLLRTIVMSGMLLVGLQIAQYYGSSAFNQSLANFYGEGVHFSVAISKITRQTGGFYAGGSFANPNVAGAFLVLPFSIAAWSIVSAQSRKDRIFWSLTVIFILIGILLTGSRTSTLSILTVLLVAYSMNQRFVQKKKKSLLFIIIGVLPLFFLGWFWLFQTSFLLRLSQGFQSDGSFSAKMFMLSQASEMMFSKNAFLGLGSGGVQVDFEYGYFWLWYGPLGLLLYFMFWGFILRSLLQDKNAYHDPQMIILVVIGFLVMNIGQTTLLSIRIFPLFIVLYATQLNWRHWAKARFTLRSHVRYLHLPIEQSR